MRYSAALVLGTLAVAQGAAHNGRHASFHARRQAESKRGMDEVNWKAVSYDLSNVDWSSVFASKPAATPTPAPAEAAPPADDDKKSSAAVEKTEATSAAYVPSATPTPEPTPTPTPTPASSKEAPAPSATEKPSTGATDLLDGVAEFFKELGIIAVGENAKADNGKIWLSSKEDSHPWKVEFINDAADDVIVTCWASSGYSGMSLNVNAPAISAKLKVGETTWVSWAAKVPGVCAGIYPDTKLANFGGVDNTWWEVTFGNQGAFDVSRNVNMNGHPISSQGSKCKANMEQCVFQCADLSASSCETGYTLQQCTASNGGGGGYDAGMGGVGGGCAMGDSSETVHVTFQ